VVCNIGCDVGFIVCESLLFGGTVFSVWCAILVVMWGLLCVKVFSSVGLNLVCGVQ
jgi:hypothetical protein